MISLDTNLLLQLPKHYLLNSKRINSDAYKGIEQYSEAKSTSNTRNSKFYNQVGYNSHQLIQDLKLQDPKNRFILIKMMNSSDLRALLFKLNKKSLLNGLKFFTKEKLLRMLKNLPKSDLVAILKEVFTNKEILEMMPVKDIQKFLGSEKIDKNEVFKHFQTLSINELSQIYEAATGKQINKKNHGEMLKELRDLRPEQFTEGLRGMPYKKMIELTKHLVDKDKSLFKEFSTEALIRPMGRMLKTELIEGMNVISNDILVKLVGELPDAMLSQVVTQIDPQKFADILLKNFTKLLDKIAA